MTLAGGRYPNLSDDSDREGSLFLAQQHLLRGTGKVEGPLLVE